MKARLTRRCVRCEGVVALKRFEDFSKFEREVKALLRGEGSHVAPVLYTFDDKMDPRTKIQKAMGTNVVEALENSARFQQPPWSNGFAMPPTRLTCFVSKLSGKKNC